MAIVIDMLGNNLRASVGKLKTQSLLLLTLCAFLANSQTSDIELAAQNAPALDITDYRSTPGVYGTVTSVGSDTLAGLMAIWAQRFQEIYPHVNFQIQATGSATASQALTQGTADIGPMSRVLSTQEIANFTDEHGYPPTALIVAIDAIAIYAEKNNPIERLTLSQVDALFSATRLCGGKQAISDWQQLGIAKFGDKRKVQLFGRNSASGTYDLFKQKALCNGDFLQTVNEMPSSSSVVQSIASSVGGLGYAALGYKNNNVKTLSLAAQGVEFYRPTPENLRGGDYPFTRYLYVIVNKPPRQPLATLQRTFLRFVLSQEGQALVEENGYFAVSDRVIMRQLTQLAPNIPTLEVIQ
ncbi:MAG: phosphate transport system substrate-binding protein [Alphaproteobacteria bacterium]|jgi:phosphate transport system substrate-binding protein